MNKSRLSYLVVVCAAASLVPSVLFAVLPPPDGGYAGQNTAEGQDALFDLTTGTNNSANGFDALYNDTSGSSNTGSGNNALFSNTTGAGNTAIGDGALYNNTTGNGNTATGVVALSNNTTGVANTAVGQIALFSNSTGSANTAVGDVVLEDNSTGGNNVAVGASAMVLNTTGSNNTVVGIGALESGIASGNNAALGSSALAGLKDGSNNIAIGMEAGMQLRKGDYNIYVGNIGAKGDSGTIRIGDGTRNTNAYVAGISGVTVAGGVGVVVDSSGHLGTVTSSARFKDNIHPMKDASAPLLSLQPVTFRYKKELDPAAIPQFGLVAEEVAKVDPDLVIRDDAGKPYTVRYEAVNAMLLNEFLKEHRKVEEQNSKIEGLETTVSKLAAALQAQGAQIEKLNAQAARGTATARLAAAQ